MFKYEYSLKRSDRRTIAVKVASDNTIKVFAPRRTPVSVIERFLNEKLGWVERCLAKNNGNNAALRDVLACKSVLVRGKAVPLYIGEKNSFSYDGISAKTPKHLKKLYLQNVGGDFLKLFTCLRQKYSFSCQSVNFKDYKAKWGCCDRYGHITFNYKLLMLPESTWRYVILHELCHTVHMDHSAKFYALLSSVMPEYEAERKVLRAYDAIIRLY